MASETGSSDPSPFLPRSMEISLLSPFILGLNISQDSTSHNLGRLILIHPFTQGMVVIQITHGDGTTNSSVGLDYWLRDIFSSKTGQPPASKDSIEALKSVEIEKEGEECAVCLEEWRVGEKAKQMPCNHIFHGGCIEKWLKIHGSCPVCRYRMPVDEDDDSEGKSSEENDGAWRRDIWMQFIFSSDRTSVEDRGSSDSSSIHQEIEGLR